MNQDDARAFVVALNSITGFVPPVMMAPLVSSPVAMIIQAVANGQMKLVPAPIDAQSQQGEAGPPRGPHLVKNDASADAAHTAS